MQRIGTGSPHSKGSVNGATVGGACSGMSEHTNQISLGLLGRGFKVTGAETERSEDK